jgi:hypothetical protein
MAVNLSPIWGAGAQLFDNSGNVLTGGKIYTYAAGTTTPATTYTSSTGVTANSNPIILNSAGRVPFEIWLTDGVVYKFVLKDSNDTLIATYDNLIGINSNFIAFTMQQEIQTATAGQTVFNLTTMQYQPSTNSLSVFVDGVNQYGPGAQYAYVETDSDTVTFVNGLHVGASVKFTTAASVSSNYANAAQVTYDPPFTGAVATNVEDKLAQTVSVKDFGAVGDGVTDDSAAIQAAIDAVLNVVFPEGTYLVTSSVNLQNGSNLQIDGDIVYTGSNALFVAAGSAGSTYTASSGASRGDLTISVTSATGLAIGDYLSISEGSPSLSGMYQIKDISGTTITLDRYLSFDITVAATIKKTNLVSVSIAGNETAQITLSNQYPRLFSGSYLVNSNVSNLIVNSTTAASSSDATVVFIVYAAYAYGLTVKNNDFVGMYGGNEFSATTIDYSSDVFVDNNTLRGFGGKVKGVELRYSSGVSATNNKLYKVPGSGVGAIFVYYTNDFSVNENQILGTVYNGANASGSGVQLTLSNYGDVANNYITEIFGIGGIYVSGATVGCTYINIVGNTINRNASGTDNHLSAIHLRVGSNITVTGNKIGYNTNHIAIWLRGITISSVVGNEVRTISSQPLIFNKAGSDPSTSEYYPKTVFFSSNKIYSLTSSASVTLVGIGTLADSIDIVNNQLHLESTSTGSSNKWGILLDGNAINIINNKLVTGFDAAATNSYMIQSLSTVTNSNISNNILEASNVVTVITTSGTGLIGSNNVYNRSVVYGFRAGAATKDSVVSVTASHYGTTAARPTLTTDDAGFMYYDTNTSSIVTWTGSAWV